MGLLFSVLGWTVLGLVVGVVSLMVFFWLMLIFGKNRNLK